MFQYKDMYLAGTQCLTRHRLPGLLCHHNSLDVSYIVSPSDSSHTFKIPQPPNLHTFTLDTNCIINA